MNSHQNVSFLSSDVIIWGKSFWHVLHWENVLYQKLSYLTTRLNHVTLELLRRFEIEACKMTELILDCTGSHLEQRWRGTRRRESYDGTFRRRQSLLNDIMVSEELTCFWKPRSMFHQFKSHIKIKKIIYKIGQRLVCLMLKKEVCQQADTQIANGIFRAAHFNIHQLL